MELRAATVDDYDAYARLVPELGVDEPLPSRTRFADELLGRALVAVDAGTVVGYALFEVLSDVGYVRNVVSAPARRRSGIGLAIMRGLHARFVAAGATAWCLNVKPDNTAAIALYERCGLRTAYRSCALRLPRARELPSPPSDVSLVPVPADADAMVEPAFGLL
ncbi:MAG: GNAT family N-acetyltransferase, partial [Myxococcota bacterium]|nr:GNAT family N-acetyltransferase [Myxococcota bacterium]